MDLSARFKMAAPCQTVKISSLMTDSAYPIARAERVQTRYGETVLLTIMTPSLTAVKIFLPKRYGGLFTDADLKNINEKSVLLTLRYRGLCPRSDSYILEIE